MKPFAPRHPLAFGGVPGTLLGFLDRALGHGLMKIRVARVCLGVEKVLGI